MQIQDMEAKLVGSGTRLPFVSFPGGSSFAARGCWPAGACKYLHLIVDMRYNCASRLVENAYVGSQSAK